MLRAGNLQGFWGDSVDAPRNFLVTKFPFDNTPRKALLWRFTINCNDTTKLTIC